MIAKQVENLNVASKNALKLEKLLNIDWLKLGINKAERKSSQYGLTSFVKAARAISKRHINCFKRIERF